MITLPLTLAIVDGFMLDIDSIKYIVPLDMVIECYKKNKSELESGESGDFTNLRGEILPFLRMREFFGIESDQTLEEENIIVLEYAGKKAGLIIDNPIGEFQTVVKPLGKIFSQLIWISGATILGTGEVALILDVPMLIKHIKDIKV